MAKAKTTKPRKEKTPAVAGNLATISDYISRKSAWVERARAKETETAEPTKLTLTAMLMKDVEISVDAEEEAYAEMINARTQEQKHDAILKIAENRKKAEAGTAEETNPSDDDDVAMAKEASREAETNADDNDEPKTPRKKGWLEKRFDDAIARYVVAPSELLADEILAYTLQMEVNRRVRFFYDLQKLRVASDLRRQGYDRIFGIKDLFIDHMVDQLKRLEKHNEKMVHRILLSSPDAEFYRWIVDNHVGVGTMMAGCMISEFSAPERFHSVSALWKYCGLAVVDNDPETGTGGHAQRRERNQLAQWNHFIRTKLLGVLTGCMIKAQTKYIGTVDEAVWGRNVKCLNDYKCRLNTINNQIPESKRVYTKSGKELFQTRSVEIRATYDLKGYARGNARACDIARRSPGHINNMAKRYMIKMFLVEILNQWRVFKGFEPLLTYDEAKLRGGVRHLGPDVRPLGHALQ